MGNFCNLPKQTPAGFHWVDFKREVATVQRVEQALKVPVVNSRKLEASS